MKTFFSPFKSSNGFFGMFVGVQGIWLTAMPWRWQGHPKVRFFVQGWIFKRVWTPKAKNQFKSYSVSKVVYACGFGCLGCGWHTFLMFQLGRGCICGLLGAAACFRCSKCHQVTGIAWKNLYQQPPTPIASLLPSTFLSKNCPKKVEASKRHQ